MYYQANKASTTITNRSIEQSYILLFRFLAMFHFQSHTASIGISAIRAPNSNEKRLRQQEEKSDSVAKEQQVESALEMTQIQNHDAVSVLWRCSD